MKYKTKPRTVEAMQLIEQNSTEVENWCDGYYLHKHILQEREGKDVLVTRKTGINVRTIYGYMRALYGDYVIKDTKGYFSSVREDIFLESYEAVE